MIAHFSGLEFDSEQRHVLGRDGAALHLTAKAFDLLTLLIEEAPRVVRKAEVHERLWPGTFVSDAALVSLVKELRRALAARDGGPPIIRTSHGVGYAFCAVLESRAAPRGARARDTGYGCGHWLVAGGRRIPLHDGENAIGRDPAATVWLDAAGVSRQHARITVKGRGATVEDVGSKNGTMLRDERIVQPSALRDGDTLRIGSVSILYRASVVGMSTETALPDGAATKDPSR